ncbi:MAG: DUF853 family protein [Deltaproteobacteria bacterium]|nr:DUF853 family protein [Deltaproteobacteria bacterium]
MMKEKGSNSEEGLKYRIPIRKFKRGYLEVPKEFLEIVNSVLDKEPLFFRDTDGREYILDIYPAKALLGGLGEWYRVVNPNLEDYIIIEPLDLDKKRFFISLEQRGKIPPVDQPEGLYVGKEYSMVGGRKYELSRDFYIPLNHLLTHVFICGATGSGKTVLGKAIVEECAMKGIPSIIIDLKGDLTSLMLTFDSLDPRNFVRWVDGRDEHEKKKNAAQEAERYQQKLYSFGFDEAKLREFSEKAVFKIFTPRSSKGIPLAFASPLAAPKDAMRLYKTDKEAFDNLVGSLSNAFVDRLYPGTKRTKIENERNYIYELVYHCWLHGINLEGKEGMLSLLRLAEEPPFKEIGGLPVDDYINAGNRRRRLVNKINTLLSGAEKMWFEGIPLKIELFKLDGVAGKTQISIINLTELEHFEDRSFVVAQVTYEIYNWMRTLHGTKSPRVLFFIDEIGAGGGKQAFYPSFPYESASKWGINYLIRQGRSYGVCCLLATQNPGDVDYKGLGNCGTWMVGKLSTDRDRKKVMEGMAVWGSDAERVKYNLVNADTGDFVVKDVRGNVRYIKERWLLSYHRLLTLKEVTELINESKSQEARKDEKEGEDQRVHEKLRSHEPKVYDLYIEASRLCAVQPESCLNTIRKALEALCNGIALETLTEKKELKKFRKSLFSDQVELLKSKGVFKNRKLIASIEFLKKWGDIASHYQEGEEFSVEDARLALRSLEKVISWYVQEFRKY